MQRLDTGTAALWASAQAPELDAHTQQHGQGSAGLSQLQTLGTEEGFGCLSPLLPGSTALLVAPEQAASSLVHGCTHGCPSTPGTSEVQRGGGHHRHMDRQDGHSCTLTWGLPCAGKAAFLAAAGTAAGLCWCHCPSAGLRGGRDQGSYPAHGLISMTPALPGEGAAHSPALQS